MGKNSPHLREYCCQRQTNKKKTVTNKKKTLTETKFVWMQSSSKRQGILLTEYGTSSPSDSRALHVLLMGWNFMDFTDGIETDRITSFGGGTWKNNKKLNLHKNKLFLKKYINW